jgi:thioredoxin reductase (NADPH)
MMIQKTFLLCLALIASPVEKEYPVVILGGGVAALTAAVQATQAGVTPVVIAGSAPGGIIIQSHSVQNWPGEIEITGADLADKLQKQAENRGAEFLTAEAIDIDTSKRPYAITIKNLLTQKVEKIYARTCIIALGATPKFLNVPGESDFIYKKIFTCAPCDGLRFKDKTVAIIGGGDSAITEADYLSNIAKKIYIVVRGKELRSTKELNKPNIEVLYNTAVESFSEKDDQLVLQTKTQNLSVDGAFLAIGSTPNTTLFKGKLELDSDGYVVLKNNQETSIPGIYAAGDISDKEFRQAMTAAGDATKAVLQAQKEFSSNSPAQTPQKVAKTTELTSLKELNQFITTSDSYSVVYFYGTTCPPCRAFRSTYDKWAVQYNTKATFAKVNSQTAQDCFMAYKIHGIPTVIVFDKKGKIVRQATGLEELSKIPKLFDP